MMENIFFFFLTVHIPRTWRSSTTTDKSRTEARKPGLPLYLSFSVAQIDRPYSSSFSYATESHHCHDRDSTVIPATSWCHVEWTS
jgi:hypothetical protein